jgi:F420-dependent oxidoreductase-like protein
MIGAMLLRIMAEAQQGADYDMLLRVARAAEGLGFDGFFRSDHYLKYGDVDGRPGPSHSWVILAGLARETTRIKLGTLMTAATFQLPGPLAIAVANVDQMSRGRVELGIGTGWYEPEHQAYGIPFPALAERFERFQEQLEIITGLWDTPVGETFSFEGKHYQLRDSPALPKPYSGRPPIVLGGGGPRRTPALAARFADEFNTMFRSVEETRTVFERVQAACAARGRARALLYSVAQEVCCGRDDREVARRAAAMIGRDMAHLREKGMTGSPAEIVDKIGRFGELGCGRIYLRMMDLRDIAHLELLASEVLPHI